MLLTPLVLVLGACIIGCLGAFQPFEVERYDNGDAFALWSSKKDCRHFNGYPHFSDTKDCSTTLGCCCEYGKTFDTRSGKCEILYDENSKGGSYRFDRRMISDTSVSTMQPYCVEDDKNSNECILISTTTNKMLPVMFKGKHLSGLCTVPEVRIIHDCQPRKLPQVTAKLERNDFDGKYYLHLESIPTEILQVFGGELLQVTVNCSNYVVEQLLFKLTGRTVLNQDKRFLNEIIPKYDPDRELNNSYCSSELPMPASSHGSNKRSLKNVFTYIGVVLAVILVLIVLIGTGYAFAKRRRRKNLDRRPILQQHEHEIPIYTPTGSSQDSVHLSSSSSEDAYKV